MVTNRKNDPRLERKLARVSGVREVKQTFLIICEGVNTEPDYYISTKGYQYKRAGETERTNI